MQPYHENLRVELAEWEKEEKSIRAIRETVFIGEQAVPAELEWDGLDPLCAHVLAWNTHQVSPSARRGCSGQASSGGWRWSNAGAGKGLDRLFCRSC